MKLSTCRTCERQGTELCAERLELEADVNAVTTPWSHPALERTEPLTCSRLAALIGRELAKLDEQ